MRTGEWLLKAQSSPALMRELTAKTANGSYLLDMMKQAGEEEDQDRFQQAEDALIMMLLTAGLLA